MTLDPTMQARRGRHATTLAGRSKVTCLQEMHGDAAMLQDAGDRMYASHHIFVSVGTARWPRCSVKKPTDARDLHSQERYSTDTGSALAHEPRHSGDP